jgi:hypothetical protein
VLNDQLDRFTQMHEHTVGPQENFLSHIGQRALANKFAGANEALAAEARAAVKRAGKADTNTGAGRGERASELNKYWDMGGAEQAPFERGGQ